jgi:hypothetical protein
MKFTLAAVLLTAALAPAQQPQAPAAVQTEGPGTLFVDAQPRDGVIPLHLADVLKVTIQIDGAMGLEVKAADKIVDSPAWRLVAATPAAATPLADDKSRWLQTLTFEPLGPGELTMPIEPFQYRNAGGAWQTLRFRPLAVKVRTTITDPDLAELRDPTIIERLPAQESSAWIPVIVIAALALVTLGAAWFILVRRSSKQATPGEHWALRELDRLSGLRLPEQGKFEGFHGLLANVVRRYLENKFELPARRRTTPEFCRVLEETNRLTPEDRKFVGDFLARCDLAKFAGAATTPADCAALAAAARDFILRTAQCSRHAPCDEPSSRGA